MSKNTTSVNVWINSQSVQRGILSVNGDDIIISLESGKILSSKKVTNAIYSPIGDPRFSNIKILFNPVLIKAHLYASDIGQITEDVFPPSSGGYYGRMRGGTQRAVFVVQRILDDEKLWLIIGDPISNRIFETQVIHPYEAEAVKLEDDHELLNEWDSFVWSEKSEILQQEIQNILDEPSPSWEIISKLVGEEFIGDIDRGKTLRGILSQVVPDIFPSEIREHLMAFLALVVTERIEMDEIVDPSSYIYAASMFGALQQGYLMCKIDNIRLPPYVDIIQKFSRGQLGQPKRTLPDFSSESWKLLWQKLVESVPNWFEDAIVIARELNESPTFRARLPVTKSQSLRSKKLWKKRMASITNGLKIRGHINHQSIGLTELVYIGSAYRWPHRHMRFITRLGIMSENPPYLQIMALPSSSAERIKRVLPQSIRISWSNRAVNLDLYNTVSEKWEVPIDEILESTQKRSSKRRVTRRFPISNNRDVTQISPNEAKVLGLVSRGILLENFELPDFFRYWNLTRKQVASSISRLTRKEILKISHEIDDSRLVSITALVQGKSTKVASFIDSLLSNTPTALVMMNNQFDKGVIIFRFPESLMYKLVSQLDQIGIQDNLMIRCMRPRAFRSFTNSLYSRLLKPDGTWDDDVSAFLSQARSKRRELSESNA